MAAVIGESIRLLPAIVFVAVAMIDSPFRQPLLRVLFVLIIFVMGWLLVRTIMVLYRAAWGITPTIRLHRTLIVLHIGLAIYVVLWTAFEGFPFNVEQWLLILWFLAPSVLTLTALSRTRAVPVHRPGRCPGCHYPLKGLRSQTCPECGQELAHAESAEKSS